ncbi:MAG: hypothetical protein LBK58_00045 [Prevotellaceae bacterium]|jgi:hypothetical protein|nr:hypothetical protein [Prevotellaceae bacterium]
MKKKNNYYYRLTVGCLCLLMAHTAKAQYTTSIELQSGTPNAKIKAKMEKNGSALLTELNNAQSEARSLSLDNIEIDKDAASSLTALWKICPFRCDEPEIKEHCLQTYFSYFGGYQIRNIPVIPEPRNDEHYDNDKSRKIVLNFDASGRISSLYFAIDGYDRIMRPGLEVIDLRRRAMIVDFVEQFLTAFLRQDINCLHDILSGDALIINGKVITRKSSNETGDNKLSPDVKYNMQYPGTFLLSALSYVFQNTESKKRHCVQFIFQRKIKKNYARINVVFEDVKVDRHSTKDDIYGVTLVLHWDSRYYSDKGSLFFLWDFKDESKPEIPICMWQPYDETPKDKVFSIE